MSIYRPQELRYAKLDSVKEERALMNNYYNDLIRHYGYDVTYWRRDADFMTDTTSEAVYGYKNDPKYAAKTGVRAFVEFNDYNFILNGEGFVPSDKVTMYFGINEFAVSFVDDVGCFANYPVDASEGYALKRNGTITVPFSSKVMSGTVVVELPDGGTEFSNLQTVIRNASVPCYSVAFNPFIYRSFSTDYRDGYYSANVLVDCTVGGSRVKYRIHGDVLYSNFFENEKVLTEIHPNPGDVVEIDYHTDDCAREQYEITEVLSRKPTNADGLSPLVGRYVYRCAAVRRIAAGEMLPAEDAAKKSRDNVMDYSQRRSDVIDEKNYDWSSPDAPPDSKVYGDYSKAETFKTRDQRRDGVEVSEIFDFDLFEENWFDGEYADGNRLVICRFTDGTMLSSDGWSLHWSGDGFDETVAETERHGGDGDSDRPPNMMYVRVKDGQVVFTSRDLSSTVVLTDFSRTLRDGIDYLDGFRYKDVGYRNRNGYYVFKNNRIALNSFDGRRLLAFSSADVEEDGKTARPFVLKERA